MQEYIPKICEWPDCSDPVKKYKSYCLTHYPRVYKVVDKKVEAKEFKQLFDSSKVLDFSDKTDVTSTNN